MNKQEINLLGSNLYLVIDNIFSRAVTKKIVRDR